MVNLHSTNHSLFSISLNGPLTNSSAIISFCSRPGPRPILLAFNPLVTSNCSQRSSNFLYNFLFLYNQSSSFALRLISDILSTKLHGSMSFFCKSNNCDGEFRRSRFYWRSSAILRESFHQIAPTSTNNSPVRRPSWVSLTSNNFPWGIMTSRIIASTSSF